MILTIEIPPKMRAWLAEFPCAPAETILSLLDALRRDDVEMEHGVKDDDYASR